MHGAGSVRGRAWAMIIIGLILAVAMVVLIIREANAVYHTEGGKSELGHRTDDGGTNVFIYAFLGYFLLFGVVCFANGVWQVKRGRPNPGLRAIMLALFFLFMTVAAIASYFR